MKKKFFALGSLFIFSVIMSNIIINSMKDTTYASFESSLDERGNLIEPIDIALNNNDEPTGDVNEKVVLVKSSMELERKLLKAIEYESFAPLYKGSQWYEIKTSGLKDTKRAVKELRKQGVFDVVDYDYVMKFDAVVESTDVSSNEYAKDLSYLEMQDIQDTWDYMNDHDVHPGGIKDVIVAVIDTGVDYNHLDLRKNIWVNSAEIPNNGIDDDNNGYIDDYHGYDFVGDDCDPIDDNGHGTHVSGIIAADHNFIGTVGIAYNTQIMCLKAGNSSGYFNNTDIAEAIQYAYMNGASVINMSFGGSSVSMAVEEALENAYNQCVLVAAAGNDSLCNQPGCSHLGATPMYPAALPYVIGVMSCNGLGTVQSSFSNFDHYPYNSIEYDVYAVGEQIPSTWPNNKYASLSGTSMATPVVSGIAALLRSTYPDRDAFSTKYLQSQIVNTGLYTLDGAHSVASAYQALTTLPKPSLNLYSQYIFDNVEFSSKNNGNGFIDAGETIHIGIEVKNRGGVASNVKASIDTIRNGDSSLVDPYVNIIQGEISLSDVGTYSVRDGNKIYQGETVVDVENHFIVEIDEDCPNEYLCSFNLNLSYTNGIDKDDHRTYYQTDSFELSVSKGVRLESFYTVDHDFPGNTRYIVSKDVTVAEGVTLNFGPGSIIQYYENSASYYETLYNSPIIKNYGTINFNGTKDNPIKVLPAELFEKSRCGIALPQSRIDYDYHGEVNAYYTDFRNIEMSDYSIDGFTECDSARMKTNLYFCNVIYTHYTNRYENGTSLDSILWMYLIINNFKNSYIYNDRQSAFSFKFNNIECSVLSFARLNSSYIRISTIKNSFINIVEKKDMSTNLGLNFIIDNSINNVFTEYKNSRDSKSYFPLVFNEQGIHNSDKFYGMYNSHPELFITGFNGNFYDENGIPVIDVNDTTNQDLSLVYPYVTNIHLEDKNGNEIKTVGTEEVKFVVDFNRDMDTTQDTSLYFGSIEPYADYKIEGDYVSPRRWEGTYTLKAAIENGEQRFRLTNAYSADEDSLKCAENETMFTFNIDTTNAMSMNLRATESDNGIELDWNQDDYDTLMGYNIYRSTEKDGNYTRINPTIIPSNENTFVDDNVEPGKTYWYTFTVVLSDFSESLPAGKVMCTAKDTINPSIYHTPVNQGYLNNNLVISCTAKDNVAVASATLYYRTKGTNEYKSLAMLKQNDKYSATIFGSELDLVGLEYYIVVSDGVNTINKGSETTPYQVVIKDATLISKIGDVDGDNVITTKDALMIMQAINGDLLLTDDEFKRADLNKDGVLSSVEALRILQYINGNVNTLEM